MSGQKLQIKYLLPNLFTAGSIFIAVLSIVAASTGNYEKAAWLIILASIFDALDGRVARLTNTTSSFGVEFDSLADVVSFGIAPALLYYFSIGHEYGKVGIFITAMFVIFGAVRLARFNVTKSEEEPNVFIGLPIPAAALIIVSWFLARDTINMPQEVNLIISGITFFAAILMVSNIRYPSFKKINLENKSFLKILIVIIFILGLTYIIPAIMIWIIMSLYAVLGPLRAIYMIILRRRQRAKDE